MENEFVTEIDSKRKSGTWYTYLGNVNGKAIRLKGYKTWLQVFTVNGIDNSGCMDISVKAFKELLIQAVS